MSKISTKLTKHGFFIYKSDYPLFFKKNKQLPQRCIVVAIAFVEGSEKEKLDKPYVIAPKDKNKEREVLVPVGERLVTDDDDIIITQDLKLQGMGRSKRR